ncbi:MAG: hypothetical protein LLF96_03070, partial [Eubacteriales bacterium]|nr:hypothetical protein [Eubacteriales bacterium]
MTDYIAGCVTGLVFGALITAIALRKYVMREIGKAWDLARDEIERLRKPLMKFRLLHEEPECAAWDADDRCTACGSEAVSFRSPAMKACGERVFVLTPHCP